MADVLPILGNIVGAGAGVVAFLMAAVSSVTVIAAAWIFYRPILGVSLLVVAVAIAVLLRSKVKKAAPAARAVPPPPPPAAIPPPPPPPPPAT